MLRGALLGRIVASQPEPDSQWTLLQDLSFLYAVAMGRDSRNKPFTVGAASGSALSGEAYIGTSFHPQVEVALARGLHEASDFARFFGPFALSGLCTTRSTSPRHARRHQAVINAFEKTRQ
jgi:NitT/TauT family transport system substrate-binding protein